MRLARCPGIRFGDDVGNAVAGEGELAGEMAVGVLIDDAADVVRIERREHAVHHHLRHRDLPAHRFAARFEIDRVGETFLGLGARRAGERQPLGRRFRPLVDAGDLAFAGDAFAGFVFAARLRRRQRRLLDVGIAGARDASTTGASPGAQGAIASLSPRAIGSAPKKIGAASLPVAVLRRDGVRFAGGMSHRADRRRASPHRRAASRRIHIPSTDRSGRRLSSS